MPESRRDFIRASAGALTLVGGTNVFAATRPNVLIILTDDQGYGDFSCHGNPVLKTPNMDRLHAASTRFTDFHVAPMCTPTRGQLLTGLNALRNGATSVTAGRAVVRRGITMLPEVFRSNGYRTGLFGKWHLGDNYPYRPMDRGFDRAFYHLGWGFSSAPEFDNDYFNGRYHDQGVRKQFTGYCTDFWFDQAMAWMKERKDKNEPFFTYLPTNTPHTPAWVDARYSSPYDQPKMPANFFGMISNLDENIGRMETFLKESGLRDNTIVIFMTDNGATLGRDVYNAGMRGHKTTIYEGGHRVPCFVRWPAGGIKAGRDVAEPAQIQDVFPTLSELCGLKTPAGLNLDGRSLAPILNGKRESLDDRMMIAQYGQIPKQYESTVIWKKWRLVYGKELYDIASDPGQKSDVAAQHPDVVSKMRGYYDGWWAQVSPKLTDFAPISIGAPQEPVTDLSSSDWQDIYCDNVNHVSTAAGGPRGGPWSVFIERGGEYEIALSRWPFWQGLALTAPRPVQKMTRGELPAGKPLPIAGAQIRIAGHELSAKSKPEDKMITFKLRLEGGVKTNLHAWFQDSAGADISGAFYARVRRLS